MHFVRRSEYPYNDSPNVHVSSPFDLTEMRNFIIVGLKLYYILHLLCSMMTVSPLILK